MSVWHPVTRRGAVDPVDPFATGRSRYSTATELVAHAVAPQSPGAAVPLPGVPFDALPRRGRQAREGDTVRTAAAARVGQRDGHGVEPPEMIVRVAAVAARV